MTLSRSDVSQYIQAHILAGVQRSGSWPVVRVEFHKTLREASTAAITLAEIHGCDDLRTMSLHFLWQSQVISPKGEVWMCLEGAISFIEKTLDLHPSMARINRQG